METLTLPVRATDCLHGREIHVTGHPALHAVGKRRGFHVLAIYLEFPAVDAEPAVLNRLLFVGKALNRASSYTKFPVRIRSPKGLFFMSITATILKIIQH